VSSSQVPKRALKMMGLKRVVSEAGESELVERENAKERELDWAQVAKVCMCVCCAIQQRCAV